MTANPPIVVNHSYAGSIVYPPGGTYGPRWQQDLQLVLLHTGDMRIDIDGTVYRVPVGHVALLTPKHTETFTFAKHEDTWHRWITVQIEPLDQEWQPVFNQLPLSIPLSDKMIRLFELIQMLQMEDSTSQEVRNNLAIAAISLYRMEAAKNDPTFVKHPAVLAAKEYIHQHCEQELPLSVVSKAARTSGEHLIRLFRKYEGLTPQQYIWTYRITRGIHLLQSSGLAIGEIAFRTGFKSSYHFARKIKQHTRLTPTEVRNENWTGNVRDVLS